MQIVCLDLEGVLIPEIWIEFSKRTAIAEFSRTTRDEPDYDKLMRYRIALLEQHGLKLADMDVIESNEAFAAQALAVAKNLGFDPAKTNPNGGAVAMGHPVGATGAIVTIKAIYELKRINKRYGLITLCIGGGQGIAAVIENLN